MGKKASVFFSSRMQIFLAMSETWSGFFFYVKWLYFKWPQMVKLLGAKVKQDIAALCFIYSLTREIFIQHLIWIRHYWVLGMW